MAKCRYTGKSVMFGNKVSHSNRKTKHMSGLLMMISMYSFLNRREEMHLLRKCQTGLQHLARKNKKRYLKSIRKP